MPSSKTLVVLASLAIGSHVPACSTSNGNGGNERLGSSTATRSAPPPVMVDNRAPVAANAPEGKAIATFAAGCFWCVEAVFEHVRGVDEVISGYSGGKEKDANYEQVAQGSTRHAEAVQIHYDPKVVDYQTLLVVLYSSMDPTQVNGQGPDIGPQYRSVVFFHDEEERRIAVKYRGDVDGSGDYKKAIAVEVAPFQRFYPAEDYHQDYEKKNPTDSYILTISKPRLERFKKRHPKLLKKTAAH